ncbi:MAG TPA: hypothetical protein VFV94_06580 [Polyangiaceae bacterium]|nr:hypothetical protein [Polyangiaceae bacterium]
MPRSHLLVALFASLGLHVAIGMWVKVRSTNSDAATERPDVWSGRGVAIAPAPLVTESVDVDEVTVDEAPAVQSAPGEQAVELEPACVADCAKPKPREASAPKPEVPRSVKKPPRVASSSTGSSPASLASGASTTSTTSAAPASTSSGSTGGATGDAFGIAGLPPGVRHLPHAFTRALSQGSWGVAGFRSAAAGNLCDVHVSIGVNDDKTLGPLEYPKEDERLTLPPLCRTMFENAYRLVEHGEFSLDASRLTAGAMRLRIQVVVSDGEPRPDSDGEPNALSSESKEAPTHGKRGRSTFVLNSGRRVDAFVNLE